MTRDYGSCYTCKPKPSDRTKYAFPVENLQPRNGPQPTVMLFVLGSLSWTCVSQMPNLTVLFFTTFNTSPSRIRVDWLSILCLVSEGKTAFLNQKSLAKFFAYFPQGRGGSSELIILILGKWWPNRKWEMFFFDFVLIFEKKVFHAWTSSMHSPFSLATFALRKVLLNWSSRHSVVSCDFLCNLLKRSPPYRFIKGTPLPVLLADMAWRSAQPAEAV